MKSTTVKNKMSRRQFLRGLTGVAGIGLLAACAGPPDPDNFWVHRDLILTNPQVAGPPPPRPQIQVQDESELARFLAISELLTGVERLDPALGHLYLQSLQASQEFDIGVSEMLSRAQGETDALPTSLDEMESRGLFEDEATRTLADKIIELWYTGIYTTPDGEPAVATFVDALAWKTLTFTTAMSICGSYRFWTEPPELEID